MAAQFSEIKNTRTVKDVRKRNENLFVLSLLGVPIIFFLVFWVYVNLDSFLLAFQREDTSTGVKVLYFTFENFEMIFEGFASGGEILIATRNTILFYLVALFIVLPVSLLMAYFVYKKIAGYKFFRTVTYLPNIICSSALVILFRYTFRKGGPYNSLMISLGRDFKNPLTDNNTAIVLLLIYNVIFGFGANMVVFGGSMNSISEDVLEAGKIDGCNWFQELNLLIIPMIWPTISTILVLSFAGILSSTGPILAMTKGDYNTSTLSFLLYKYATGAVPGSTRDPYFASAVGLLMTVVTFPIVLLLRKVLFRDEKEAR